MLVLDNLHRIYSTRTIVIIYYNGRYAYAASDRLQSVVAGETIGRSARAFVTSLKRKR